MAAVIRGVTSASHFFPLTWEVGLGGRRWGRQLHCSWAPSARSTSATRGAHTVTKPPGDSFTERHWDVVPWLRRTSHESWDERHVTANRGDCRRGKILSVRYYRIPRSYPDRVGYIGVLTRWCRRQEGIKSNRRVTVCEWSSAVSAVGIIVFNSN